MVKTSIHGKDSLYQVVDGQNQRKPIMAHNTYGYITAIARKLGKYNPDKQELEAVKWLPDAYTPVFLCRDTQTGECVNDLSVGSLPGTDLSVLIKDVNGLITHNYGYIRYTGYWKVLFGF